MENIADIENAANYTFIKWDIVDATFLDQLFVEHQFDGDIWQGNYEGKRYYHISTDEVYGSLGAEGLFTETTAYDPNSPYSALKASSDHFVGAYGETIGFPYVLTNCNK